MFDTKQNTQIQNIDNRVLPDKGLISISRLFDYAGVSLRMYESTKQVDKFIDNCSKYGILVFPTSGDKKTWLVSLESFKTMTKQGSDEEGGK